MGERLACRTFIARSTTLWTRTPVVTQKLRGPLGCSLRRPLAMAVLHALFVIGALMVDSVHLMFDSPENGIAQVRVFCDGELTDDYHCDQCDNDHRTRAPHKCSCGKCSSVALFEHSCPLAYDPQTLGSVRSRSTSVSYYESASFANAILQSHLYKDGKSTRTALATLGRHCLPILSRAFSCDRQQCFLYVGAHQCTSLQDDYGIQDLLHNKTNPLIERFNTDKETLKIQLVEQIQKSNTFTSRRPYPHQHLLIKTKFYLPYKSVRHNQAETTRDPVDVANLVLLLLMLSGDIELNPGPCKLN